MWYSSSWARLAALLTRYVGDTPCPSSEIPSTVGNNTATQSCPFTRVDGGRRQGRRIGDQNCSRRSGCAVAPRARGGPGQGRRPQYRGRGGGRARGGPGGHPRAARRGGAVPGPV